MLGGSSNDYDYVSADPINDYDLEGRWGDETTRKWFRWAATGVGVVALAACILATVGVCAAAAWTAVAVSAVSRSTSFNSMSEVGLNRKTAAFVGETAIDSALVFVGGRSAKVAFGGVGRHLAPSQRFLRTGFRVSRQATAATTGWIRPWS
jgi:hypothetical protein